MLLILISGVLAVNQPGLVIESGTAKYTLCELLGEGHTGAVHAAVSEEWGDPKYNCESENRLALKCGNIGRQEMYRGEADYMSTLSSESWVPRIYEYFTKLDGSEEPCIAMELLGRDLHGLRGRNAKGPEWPWVRLGSIGARMLEIVEILHNKYILVHTDLHSGNWMLPRGLLNSELKMIDYGHCRPLQAFKMRSRDSYALEEIRQVIINIRYLFDGDFTFYAWKRYKFNEAEICAGVHPALCEALVYVNDLREGDALDYSKLHGLMVSLVEETGAYKYENRLIWEPHSLESHPERL